ncbi:MAG: DNA-deoxyinosine glycosylase [Mogibacterium sp.]|nr:DNA-deoxyinosine glycosylase [Mogibacterium sp.]
MGARATFDHGFGPFYDMDSRILILGSFPSVKSRAASFYYGHPQNRFWKVMAAIAGETAPVTLPDKQAFLRRNHIALYDVIQSCSIEGSSDSSIADVVVTDLRPVLAGSSVGMRIYTNGGKAHELYMKYQYPQLGIEAIRLPSTSPANAAMSLDRLIAAWSARIGSLE